MVSVNISVWMPRCFFGLQLIGNGVGNVADAQLDGGAVLYQGGHIFARWWHPPPYRDRANHPGACAAPVHPGATRPGPRRQTSARDAASMSCCHTSSFSARAKTARKAAPYFRALTSPTPDTDRNSSMVCGRGGPCPPTWHWKKSRTKGPPPAGPAGAGWPSAPPSVPGPPAACPDRSSPSSWDGTPPRRPLG